MTLPFFFEDNIPADESFYLSESTSRHIFQVLRMKEGEQILTTNGNGYSFICRIVSPDKKKTQVSIIEKKFAPATSAKLTIAISPIKNKTRFEWFIEKATEIGVHAIVPLLCKRTETAHFKRDRLVSIMTSAMLQSRQVWLPELSEPAKMNDVLKRSVFDERYIAHCIDEEKRELRSVKLDQSSSRIILIGPEGDFTEDEIKSALQQNYIPVSLGDTRLRTETAGVVSAVLLTR
ncbi:MAG TPA: RsmE family RNA methyltransferase [Hanamia sp.]